MTDQAEEEAQNSLSSAPERTHPLAWSRNDEPIPSPRKLVLLISTFMSIGFLSLTMAYFGPGHTEAWTQRFDRLEMRAVPPGTGFGIDLLRLVLFVSCTVWLIGTRFTSSIRDLFRLTQWSTKLFLSRGFLFAVVAYFVISESRRHWAVVGAAEDMLQWATEHGLETTAQLEVLSYRWFLPYSLVFYILVFGGLLAFPLMRFWFSDLQYVLRQTDKFVDYQKQCRSANEAVKNLQYFAHEYQNLSRKYIDGVALICLGIQYEYWIGHYTLTDAGVLTAILGFVVVIFTAATVVGISAVFSRGIAATDQAILLAGQHEDAIVEAGTYNILWFLRRVVLGHLGGVAILSLAIVAVHASLVGYSAAAKTDQSRLAFVGEQIAGEQIAGEQTEGERGIRLSTSSNAADPGAIDVPRANRPALPTDCHLLTIGISSYADQGFNLQFADKDAIEIAAAFERLEGRVFRKVSAQTLVNEQANKNQILNSLATLHAQLTQHDIAIVTIAGHGITDQFDDFFFLPYDYDTDKQLDFSGISWNDLSRWLRRMPCMVWIVLDTCHSGRVTQLGGRGVEQQRIERVTRKALSGLAQSQTGIVITAGSMSDQSAFERSEWGHGALTKALLEGLGDSPENRQTLAQLLPSAEDDGTLSLGELIFYASKRVNALTEGKQAVVTNHTGNINMDLIPLTDFGSN
ncbi:MAG: caspase family protein [Planctomycetales bacterium]|nr:caspase family protein [Planctomycetales bacterium]